MGRLTEVDTRLEGHLVDVADVDETSPVVNAELLLGAENGPGGEGEDGARVDIVDRGQPFSHQTGTGGVRVQSYNRSHDSGLSQKGQTGRVEKLVRNDGDGT